MKIRSLSIVLAAAVFAGCFAFAPSGVPVGVVAPDFEIAEWRNSPDGASTLAELRGRVVLLDFWRTW